MIDYLECHFQLRVAIGAIRFPVVQATFSILESFLKWTEIELSIVQTHTDMFRHFIIII